MTRKWLFIWFSGVLGGFFLLLGLVFILTPKAGAAIHGVAGDGPGMLLYVRAVGFRDLALSAYLIGLAYAGSVRGLTILGAATVVIPISDTALLILSPCSPGLHYVLHASSALCLAAMAILGRDLMRTASTGTTTT
ncbi:DUF4267 domain-containing protein [Sphingomonas fuzhouensis]|uniref:DUF4267 domain-containing protein n=1 Tax=Sphingomonas fuzhouensis TaxID=3106033 RepID=UPI002AFFDCAA|nr:DUF4267 domain-containing protein [Sphingomonas sp. SGZ-02]